MNRELETSLTITKQPVIARCKSCSRIFSRRITLITVAMNLDKKEVAITRRKSRPSLEQKLVYHSKQWHRLSRARIPAWICSFRDERKKFLILLSFTKPVYKTINHRTSFLAPALDFFRLIKHVYTPDPRIIINFFRLKRNRIAAIRRINLFLFERKEKNFRPSYLLRLLFRLTRKIFTNIFLEWICKIFRIHVCTKMYREQPFLVRGLLVFL